DVPSIGPQKAQMLHQRLGVSSVDELREAARAHRLQGLPGIGPKMEERILRETERPAPRTDRMLLADASRAAAQAVALLAAHPGVQDVQITGSVRRNLETAGDIDLVISSDNPRQLLDELANLSIVKRVTARTDRGS